MYMANQALFVYFASMLWAFDIRDPVDEATGIPIVSADTAFENSGALLCVILTRSPLVSNVVRPAALNRSNAPLPPDPPM